MFQIKRRDGLARIGVLSTHHGDMETPALLPVINPSKIVVSCSRMRRMGVECVITNAYIIHRHKSLREYALERGIHTLIDFNGPIMTDSGTFQSHVYGDIDITNRQIVEFQREIGADIGTILDVFTGPDASREEAEKGVIMTLKRAEDAVTARGEMFLAVPVQGSIYPDLRRLCAEHCAALEVQVHPIGGVVPLMENYRFADLVRVVMAARLNLPPERPVHLFGAGHPMVYALAALMGIDMMDSAAYAKYAADDRMLFVWGTRHLEEMEYLPCTCPVCAKRTPQDLRGMNEEKRQRLLAEHNLWVSIQEILAVREAIAEKKIWQYAEMRCSSHPRLLEAYDVLLSMADDLLSYEPLSRKGEFVLRPESLHRPAFLRYRRRLRNVRIDYPHEVIDAPILDFVAPSPPDYREKVPIYRTPFGYVPHPLCQIYPVAHTQIVPGLPLVEDDLIECVSLLPEVRLGDRDLLRIRAVCDFQFGPDVSDHLLRGEISVIKSKSTGRIRNVFSDGAHILSMRNDGFFSLKREGALRILECSPSPRFRVVVTDDSADFNRLGRNVFTRFVLKCDPQITPGEEVIIVDADDRLVAVGRSVLLGAEMIRMKRGIAVKVREGFTA